MNLQHRRLKRRTLPPRTTSDSAGSTAGGQNPKRSAPRRLALAHEVDGQIRVGRQRSGGLPAESFSALYAGVLLVIPSSLVIGAIGAAGTPANLIAIAGLVAWMAMTLRGWNPSGWTPIRTMFALFVLTVLMSYVAGHVAGWYQPADIHQRTDRLWVMADVPELTDKLTNGADRGLLALAGWAGIFLLTADGVRSWHALERLTQWIVRFATFVAGLAILQYFTGLNVAAALHIPGLQTVNDFSTFARSDLNRVVATAMHPIELGVIMAALLPLALHRGIHSTNWRGWLPAAMLSAVVLMSISRSAIVVAGGAILILFLGWPWRWRLVMLAVMPLAILGARAAFPGLIGTIRALFVFLGDDPSIAGRTDDYAVVARNFWEHPILGQGFYTWIPMYFRTLDNQLLVLLLEIGIVGTLAFVGMILTAVFSAVVCHRRVAQERNMHLALAIAAGIFAISLSYITFDTLGFRQAAGVTFLLVGMAAAAWRLSRSGATVREFPANTAAPDAARVDAQSTDSAPSTRSEARN